MAFVGVQWRLLLTDIFCRHLVLGFVGVRWRAVASISGVCCLPIFLGDICYWHSVAFVGVQWPIEALWTITQTMTMCSAFEHFMNGKGAI